MDPDRLSASLEAAFLALLDDDSPAVRAGLVAAFTQHGPAAIEFLQAAVRGSDRLRARASSRFSLMLKNWEKPRSWKTS